jgi:hypothetical protein
MLKKKKKKRVRVVLKIFVDLKNYDLIFIGEIKILKTITHQKKKKFKTQSDDSF